MSSWYRADELAHRIAIFFAGVALANMYADPIGIILGYILTRHFIQVWRADRCRSHWES